MSKKNLVRVVIKQIFVCFSLSVVGSSSVFADNQAESLPELPRPSSFQSSQSQRGGEWGFLGNSRFNLSGPQAGAKFRRFLNTGLRDVLSPSRFRPALPWGARMVSPLRTTGSGRDVTVRFQAEVQAQGCPLGISPSIEASFVGRTEVTRLGRGNEALLYGRVPCDQGYRIRMNLAGSSSGLTDNVSYLVLDVCMREVASDGSLAVDLYSSVVFGNDWGTRCAGENVRRLLAAQTRPLSEAIQGAYLAANPPVAQLADIVAINQTVATIGSSVSRGCNLGY